MQKSKLILLAFLTTTLSLAQSKKIQEVGNFAIRNADVIKDKNSNVEGYYFFYAIDKLKKGQLEYNIQILDNNLNEVAKKTYVDDKYTTVMTSGYNNEAMMFAMFNPEKNFVKLLSFDKQANQRDIVEIPLKFSESLLYKELLASNLNIFLMPVEDRGFLFNRLIDNKKLGYAINYYPTDGGKAWTYQTDPKSNEWLTANIIEATQDHVVVLEMARNGKYSSKTNLTALVLDAKTGKLIFKKEYVKKANPRTITNAIFTDNSVIFMGEYFNPDDNVFFAKAIGIFGEEINMTGETINESLVSWKNDVDPMLKESGNSDDGNVMLHKMVRTENGDIFAIGERYKKNPKNIGFVKTSPGMPSASLLITDVLSFKFNSSLKLTEIKKFDKGTSFLNVPAAFAKYYGFFDYGFTQIDKKNDRFYAMFLDAERAGVKRKNIKYAYKAIIYDDGQLSEDKIELSSEDSLDKTIRMIPAKVGFIALIDFDKELKEINVRLEKVNIM